MDDTVLFKLDIPRPPCIVREVSFRKLEKIDHNLFVAELNDSDLVKLPPEDLESFTAVFNDILFKLIDKHALVKTRSMVERPMQPWFNDQIK